ncbi:hypothetical protein DFR72_10217 [Lentzea flaviverrucosa]|uniref:Uncharacterized protein n=2 Tax=Lentzea flaviverrucosa TaxID=200379 RepID=A0A1H9QTD4_9PSEU|nr:hypothetical protein DFR72_10217 [Lentzea flaviverrucosa]SER63871.1 hypothetical protein SAMN05216195_10618 [Lentzea flaviverrucosa]
MPQEPYRGLVAAFEAASDWGLALSALGCVHRTSAVLVAEGVVEEDAAPFSTGSLVELAELRDTSAVLSALMSARQSLAVYGADPETGEVRGESDRAELLAMASELVLRADANADRAFLEEWASMCSSISIDVMQHLDCMELRAVAEFGSTSPSPYEDVPPLPAAEIQAQLEILRLVDGRDADALTHMAKLSDALRSALVVIAAEAVSSGELD